MKRYRKGESVGVGTVPGPVERLRALTFLSPGIPAEFFQLFTQRLARALGVEIELEMESRFSGPMHEDDDPFAEGRADLGFLCSPSFLYWREQAEPSIELVPAGFVFSDERAQGDPVYFSDVVVRADHPAREFGDLAGAAWGYNDDCSLSGHFAALQKLAELGCSEAYFGRRVRTGSHADSVVAILEGSLDGAAIDSTVLGRMKRERPELGRNLRVIDSWGPFPIQPIVVRRGLGSGWAQRIALELLKLHPAVDGDPVLIGFRLECLVPIDESSYAEERRALCALGQLSSPVSRDLSS
ncbi:MAG: phosphonate transport system substrate-binding protein [Planctomycetota bacterium]|jgi:phosphonate transport system substrate-binding protein